MPPRPPRRQCRPRTNGTHAASANSLRQDEYPAAFDGKFQLILLLCIVCRASVEARFLVRRYRSYRRPTIAATIEKGAVGTISFGKGVSCRVGFLWIDRSPTPPALRRFLGSIGREEILLGNLSKAQPEPFRFAIVPLIPLVPLVPSWLNTTIPVSKD